MLGVERDPSRRRSCAQCSDHETRLRCPAWPQDPADVPAIDDWSTLLDGKVAVVTGGGDGIGGAISRLFAEHGAHVEIAEIDPERAAAQAGRDRGRRRLGASTRRRRPRRRRRRTAPPTRCSTRTRTRRCPRQQRRRLPTARPVSEVDARVVGRDVPDQPAPLLLGDARVPRPDDRRRRRIDRQRPLGRRHARLPGRAGLRRDERRRSRTSPRASRSSMGRHGIRVNGIGPDLTQTPQVDYGPVSEHDDMWESWAPVGRLGWPEDQARVALFLASDMSALRHRPQRPGRRRHQGRRRVVLVALGPALRQPTHDALTRRARGCGRLRRVRRATRTLRRHPWLQR